MMATLDTISNAPKCQRCKTITEGQYCLVMSYFNTQLICEGCERKEQDHPFYTRARIAELEAIKAKNFNFVGIGLPESLNC